MAPTTPYDALASMYAAVSDEQLTNRLAMLTSLANEHHDRECALLRGEISRRHYDDDRPLPPMLIKRGKTVHEVVAWAPDGDVTSPLGPQECVEAQREGYRLFSRTITTTDWYEVRLLDFAGTEDRSVRGPESVGATDLRSHGEEIDRG